MCKQNETCCTICGAYIAYDLYKCPLSCLEPQPVSPCNALTISVGQSAPLRHTCYSDSTRRRFVATDKVMYIDASCSMSKLRYCVRCSSCLTNIVLRFQVKSTCSWKCLSLLPVYLYAVVRVALHGR